MEFIYYFLLWKGSYKPAIQMEHMNSEMISACVSHDEVWWFNYAQRQSCRSEYLVPTGVKERQPEMILASSSSSVPRFLLLLICLQSSWHWSSARWVTWVDVMFPQSFTPSIRFFLGHPRAPYPDVSVFHACGFMLWIHVYQVHEQLNPFDAVLDRCRSHHMLDYFTSHLIFFS